jgi:replicative DNA helicase
MTTAEIAAVSKYEFDQPFQRKIVALTLRDNGFATQTEGLVLPEYFENQADAALVSIGLDYFKKFKSVPTSISMIELIKKAIQSKRIRKDMIEDVKACYKEMFSMDISDKAFVAEEVGNFARFRALENAILSGAEALLKRDFNKIEELIKKANLVGLQDDDLGYDYFGEIENRTDERIALASGLIAPTGISSGIKEIDEFLYHKGWGRKELSCIMGAAKAGKSMSLGEFAKNASLDGYNVLYVTLEVGRKIIVDRLDANITSTAMKALNLSANDVKMKLDAATSKGSIGTFHVKEFATGSLKCSQLRRVIEKARARGVVYDLVVLDYADIMSPEFRSNEFRDDMRNIYIDLRAIAFDYDIALLTATQTNREGAKSVTPKATDLAEDFNKARIVDVLLAITATDAEKKANEARIVFALNRNGQEGVTITVSQDRSQMAFIKKVLRVE